MKIQMAYILIIIGLVSLVSGVLMLSKNDKISSSSSARNNTENVVLASQELISTTPKIIIKPEIIATQSVDKLLTSNNLIKNTEPKEKTSDDLKIASKMKGDAFEQHVVKRFASKYFRIKEWRGDKYIDGIYAESNRHPDLEISFKLSGQEDLFAVECKWRKDYVNDQIEWAEAYQFAQYQKFSKERNLPVFIIIGVGGLPNEPKDVYVIPLKQINSQNLKLFELRPYLKENDKGFYWNNKEKSLS